MKKTKIVATIGPASANSKTLEAMVNNGLNVVRMNFSHGTWNDHQNYVSLVRKAAKKTRKDIALLQDLSGPKIRIGEFSTPFVEVKKGQKFDLHTKKVTGDENGVYVNYKKITKDLKVGSIVKINDGKIKMQVTEIAPSTVSCKVVIGGTLSSRKGVNLPGTVLSMSSLTSKDKKDVLFGIQNEVDFVAFSFVQNARDVRALRRILEKHNSKARIIAKIETVPAIKNIDEIIEATDGIMVARGDLAIEIGVEQLPLAQKEIIEKCNIAGKPVITATQMLETMEENAVPTRAEVSDIANAIMDGSDAIMLSGESSVGKYPAEAVEVMSTVAQSIEQKYKNIQLDYLGESLDVVDAITSSTVRIANNVRARGIVAMTESGFTAQMLSRFKAHHAIIALTPNDYTLRRLALSYGVQPFACDKPNNINEAIKFAKSFARKKLRAVRGERIVVCMGLPFGKPGNTNMNIIVTI
jgi:pyruvate kinase